jgi:hypothetical protein
VLNSLVGHPVLVSVHVSVTPISCSAHIQKDLIFFFFFL